MIIIFLAVAIVEVVLFLMVTVIALTVRSDRKKIERAVSHQKGPDPSTRERIENENRRIHAEMVTDGT